VRRILTKMEGVQAVAVDVPAKSVVVTGPADPAAMTEALKKWAAASGKEVTLLA
jgi:hypothetical protein